MRRNQKPFFWMRRIATKEIMSNILVLPPLIKSARRSVETEDKDNFVLVGFVNGTGEVIREKELVERATELNAVSRPKDADKLFVNQSGISKQWRQFVLVFAGAVGDNEEGVRCVTCMNWSQGDWHIEAVPINGTFYWNHRLVRNLKYPLSSSF